MFSKPFFMFFKPFSLFFFLGETRERECGRRYHFAEQKEKIQTIHEQKRRLQSPFRSHYVIETVVLYWKYYYYYLSSSDAASYVSFEFVLVFFLCV